MFLSAIDECGQPKQILVDGCNGLGSGMENLDFYIWIRRFFTQASIIRSPAPSTNFSITDCCDGLFSIIICCIPGIATLSVVVHVKTHHDVSVPANHQHVDMPSCPSLERLAVHLR